MTHTGLPNEERLSFHIRLFDAETAATETPSGLSPRMSLSEFFEEWFLPIVLKSEQNASEGTIRIYRTALDWWRKLTGDPPLAQIDEFTVGEFVAGLRTATFQRGPCSPKYPLAPHTIFKQQKQIKTILARVGPTIDPRRPGKKLVAEAPYIRVAAPQKGKPKASFTLEAARRIAAAAIEFDRPKYHSLATATFWKRLLGGLFYSGLRFGTVWRLRWEMLAQEDDGSWWLDVPEQTKTGKRKLIVVHSLWLAALQPIQPSGRIFPTRPGKSNLDDLHKRLQELAGIPLVKQMPFQAWRRTHSTQMALLGAKAAKLVAQHSLDHGDDRTTTDHYADIDNMFRPKLPVLWEADVDQRQRRLFL